MSLTWLETEGGPLIVVPRTALPHWSGTEGDYDRACKQCSGLPLSAVTSCSSVSWSVRRQQG
ncbi:Imm21 family immunity protein [Streptomyces sp. B21-101]|uniref:Imm21 family immunity protein n=1 Tax=Streptomyces sp. B21-101 TaxID=3039415 RepID=UPI002FEE73DF